MTNSKKENEVKQETGVVDIRGKQYHTVAKRVNDFREEHGDNYGLCTEIVENSDRVVVRALIVGREDNFVVATGTAEEQRGAGQINKTSALENCETSAIGRALASFGIGGTEFSSANEVQNAIHQQEGQSQGDGQGAVSSPAPRNWGGRYPTKTALKKAMHEHHAELRRIGDEATFEDLESYLTSPEYSDYIKIADEHAKVYLEGGEGAPDGFECAYALEQRARDLIALRSNIPLEKEAAE